MTFKEARQAARENHGAYIGRFKDGGWYVDTSRGWGYDNRNIYYVYRDGRLDVVNTLYAKEYQRKYLKKKSKTP